MKVKCLSYHSFLMSINIIFAEVSHLIQHGYFPYKFQPFYEPVQQIKPTAEPSQPTTTTTQFFLPEIIINKRAKTETGYDYVQPSKPPQNTYLPPAFDNQFENQEPLNNEQQFESPLIGIDNGPVKPVSDGYLPPKFNRTKATKNSNIFITYEKKDLVGYDYNAPTKKPIPIFIPTPAVGADLPIEGENSVQNGSDTGYNYESPFEQDIISSTRLPPPSEDPQISYLPSLASGAGGRQAYTHVTVNSKIPIKLHLKEMKCLKNRDGYFKALLRLDSLIGLIPIVDNDILDSRCDIKLVQSHIIINIVAEDFNRCNVKICGDSLCLRVRFPTIQGMKTGEDSLLTLQCKTQEKVIAKVHSLKMGISNDVHLRSIGAFARGGNQQPFRTHIELIRKLPNGLTRNLESNSVVKLGEELLLRAHVITGDGWNHTKLTDINLQRMSSSGEVINSANLITPDGCVNPTMQSICPILPTFDPPLGNRLFFRVIMFQGMQSGEEIVMSMKITGCIERADCYVDKQYCNNAAYGRLKRSLSKVKKTHGNSIEFEEIANISFRVIVPHDDRTPSKDWNNADNQESNQSLLPILICGISSLILFVSCLLSIFYFRR